MGSAHPFDLAILIHIISGHPVAAFRAEAEKAAIEVNDHEEQA